MKKNDSSDKVKVPSKPGAAKDASFGPTPDTGKSEEYGKDKIGAPKEPPKAPGAR